jgi:hypothetical protein
MKHPCISSIFISLLIVAPVGALHANHSDYREEIVTTEAGKIDFRFLGNIKNPQVFHRIVRICPESHAVELEDGSMWTVPKIDNVKGWEKSHRLVLTQNQATFSTHRYALVNPDLKLAVPASLAREPTPKDKDLFYVKAVDRVNDIVVLNDNKHWIVNASDRSVFNKIVENDRAILGVNTKEIDKKSPYIIIDTADKGNVFVRACLVD